MTFFFSASDWSTMSARFSGGKEECPHLRHHRLCLRRPGSAAQPDGRRDDRLLLRREPGAAGEAGRHVCYCPHPALSRARMRVHARGRSERGRGERTGRAECRIERRDGHQRLRTVTVVTGDESPACEQQTRSRGLARIPRRRASSRQPDDSSSGGDAGTSGCRTDGGAPRPMARAIRSRRGSTVTASVSRPRTPGSSARCRLRRLRP